MTPTSAISPAIQDYLRAIYQLSRRSPDNARVTTSNLADWMGIRPASVTAMLQRIAAADPPLVDYEKHHGVRLTDEGEAAALQMVRFHRLLELYLYDRLGYGWDEVHEEADRLEHVISPHMAERIALTLDNPTHDPHGHPIPGPDLLVDRPATMSLTALQAGERGVVRHVRDEDPAVLRRLGEAGVRPGQHVELLQCDDATGERLVKLSGVDDTMTLPLALASQVFIEAD